MSDYARDFIAGEYMQVKGNNAGHVEVISLCLDIEGISLCLDIESLIIREHMLRQVVSLDTCRRDAFIVKNHNKPTTEP